MEISHYCRSEEEVIKVGNMLANAPLAGCCIYLNGDLGAGKTTLVRAVLKAVGVVGSVHSPTYALVEPYEEVTPNHFHFDLYRLQSPWELEELGVEEYFTPASCCWIEWPEKAESLLPQADLTITIESRGEGRDLRFVSNTTNGDHIIDVLNLR